MLKVFVPIFCGCVILVSSQNWITSSYVQDNQQFFSHVIQETVYELERREWCNLKIDNIYQTINDSLYNFVVNGTVMYHNGFLISIQKMDISNTQSIISSGLDDDNNTAGFATSRGSLNLYDVKVGFDVEVNLANDGAESTQRYTGTYNHNRITFQLWVQKNLNTGEITAGSTLLNLAAGAGIRMIYMPTNNVTEALSRRWVPSNNWDSIRSWGTDHIAPIMAQIVSSRIPFPGLCIGCNA